MKRKNFTAVELKTVLSYDPETGIFTRRKPWGSRKVGDIPGCLSKYGYWQIGVFNQTYGAQVLAWLYVHGEWPQFLVDHANGIKTDNRISNLQLLDYSLNAHNTELRKTNTSGVKGVSFRSLVKGKIRNKPWRADIMASGKRTFLGAYVTFEEAVAARHQAEKQIYTHKVN
jgi:hypothetical protein